MNYPSYMNYQPQRYAPLNNGITWVQGIEGAKAYQLMPNSNTILLDSENDGIFYIKLSDNVGMCTLRTFKYTETTNEQPKQVSTDLSEYVTKTDLKEAIEELKEIIANEQFVSAVKPNKDRQLDYNV